MYLQLHRLLLFCLLTTLITSTSQSQTTCFGAGFESSNSGPYSIYNGKIRSNGSLIFNIGDKPNRSQIMHLSDGPDPIANAYCITNKFLPVVAPDGGIYSMRLGNEDNGKEADKVTLSFKVDKDLPFFLLRYAVVLNDPGHKPYQQPRFELRILDESGKSLSGCGEYSVKAAKDIPGFESCRKGWRVRPWTTVGFNLSQYIDQTIHIEILVTDCSQGGHAGYAYIDASCQPLDINLEGYCIGNSASILSVTEGFSNYLWSTGAITPSIAVENPIEGDIYAVTVTNVTGCTLVIQDTIPPLDSLPLPIFNTIKDTTACIGNVIKVVPRGKNIASIKNLNTGEFADSFNLAPRASTTYTFVGYDRYKCASDTVSFTIGINNFLMADFTTSQTTFCAGDTVNFQYASKGYRTTTNWDFGDGTVFKDSIPPPIVFENTSSVPRNITISLTESNNCSVDKIKKTIIINPSNIIADFEATALEICEKESVTLYNSSTANTAIEYRLGDGNTSTNLSTTHTYESIGTYDITLTASSNCKIDTITKTILVKPLPDLQIEAEVFACVNDTIQLSVNSSHSLIAPVKWTINNATHPSTSFIPKTTGEQHIEVLAQSINTCTNTSKKLVQTIPLPSAEINITDTICVNDSILIKPAKIEEGVHYEWDFSDNQKKEGEEIMHKFKEAGSHSLVMIATNEYECSSRDDRQIQIHALPDPDFSIKIINDCTPAAVIFKNETIGANYKYKWRLQAETFSNTTDTVSYTFEEGGIYTIELIAITSLGCEQSISKQFTIKQTPLAEIASHENKGCGSARIPLQARVCEGCTYIWEAKTPDTIPRFSYSRNPIMDFEPGTIDIQLSTTAKNLCVDTAFTTITVYEPLEVIFDIQHNLCHGAKEGSITTRITGGTPPYAYTWEGVHTNKDLVDVSAGTYLLKVTDKNGCFIEKAATVNQPLSKISAIKQETIVKCFGGNDGKLNIEVTGGTPPYTFFWETGDTTSFLNNKSAQNYALTITDANNCLSENTFELGQNPSIEIGNAVRQISCFGEKDGAIILDSVKGGTPPYWGNIKEINQEGTRFTGLSAATYTLLIKDSLACFNTLAIPINSPPKTWVEIQTSRQSIQQGETLDLDLNYPIEAAEIVWSSVDSSLSCINCNNPQASPLRSTLYTVALTDNYGCTVYDSLDIDVVINRGVAIATAFKPSSEENPIFFLQANNPGIQQVSLFRVRDRLGGILYEAKNFPVSDSSFGWDGSTTSGEIATYGVYYYEGFIKYIDGEIKSIRGEFKLLH